MFNEGKNIGSEKNKHLEKFLNALEHILPDTPYQMEELEFLFDIQRHELLSFLDQYCEYKKDGEQIIISLKSTNRNSLEPRRKIITPEQIKECIDLFYKTGKHKGFNMAAIERLEKPQRRLLALGVINNLVYLDNKVYKLRGLHRRNLKIERQIT